MEEEKEYKVFKADTIRQSFKDCIKEGYRPLKLFEVINARADGLIPWEGYDCATFDVKGNDGKIRVSEDDKHIKAIISDTDRNVASWYVGRLEDRSYANGRNHLDGINGRLVGVKNSQ